MTTILSEIAKETTMAIDKNIQTDDEIAKLFINKDY